MAGVDIFAGDTGIQLRPTSPVHTPVQSFSSYQPTILSADEPRVAAHRRIAVVDNRAGEQVVGYVTLPPAVHLPVPPPPLTHSSNPATQKGLMDSSQQATFAPGPRATAFQPVYQESAPVSPMPAPRPAMSAPVPPAARPVAAANSVSSVALSSVALSSGSLLSAFRSPEPVPEPLPELAAPRGISALWSVGLDDVSAETFTVDYHDVQQDGELLIFFMDASTPFPEPHTQRPDLKVAVRVGNSREVHLVLVAPFAFPYAGGWFRFANIQQTAIAQ